MPYCHIVVYTALLTPSHIYVKGRLLGSDMVTSKATDGYWRAMWISLRRALTKELKHHPLQLSIDKNVVHLTTDHEGYFEYLYQHNTSLMNVRRVAVLSTIHGVQHCNDVPLKAFLESRPLGIISDIDDTILITKVRSFFKLRMLFNTVFINPFRRKSVEAAAKYYATLLRGLEGGGPIVYISNSPWNMYDYLQVFLRHNGFPNGELQLRDFGLQMLRRKKPLHKQNKYLEICRVLQVFSETKFVLVGDTAERDFDIYTAIRSKFPDRIDRIVIVKTGNTANEKRIQKIMGQTESGFIDFVHSFEELLAREQSEQ